MRMLTLIWHYALFSLGVLILYSIIYWINYHYNTVSIKRIYSEFFIPLVLALLIILLFISPKIAGLPEFQFTKPGLYNFLMFFAVAGIFIPLFCSSQYMQFFLPKIEKYNSPEEITSIKRGTYYSFRECYAYKQGVHLYVTGNVAGKSSEYRRISIFFICPFIKSPNGADTNASVKLWTGTYFSRSESRFSRPKDLQPDFDEYKAICTKLFQEKEYSSDIVFYSPQESGFRDQLITAIKTTGRNDGDKYNVLIPIDSSMSRSAHIRLVWMVLSYLAGVTLWALIIWITFRLNH